MESNNRTKQLFFRALSLTKLLLKGAVFFVGFHSIYFNF